jgi:hypothetical protein
MRKLEATTERVEMPSEMARDFIVQVRVPADSSAGEWVTVAKVKENYKRLVKLPFDPVQTDAVRIVVEKTWGAEKAHIFAFDVN